MLVFGLAMIAMMIFRPQGILPRRPRTLRSEAGT
jgi:ABC-type branched-subunit amino acid transport system permease subunit